VEWLPWLIGIPLLAFALWLKFRPYRNGTFSQLWGAPSDDDDVAPPDDKRLFGPFPEDEQSTPTR
jgi:hypothetical protein